MSGRFLLYPESMATPNVITMEIDPTTVVGISGEFTSAMEPNSNAQTVIPQLWRQHMDATGENFFHAQWSVGVMNDLGESGKMNYVAAIRIGDNDERVDGLDVVELSGGRYAACEHVGSLDTIAETTAWFYGDYLPSSSLRVRDAYHLEIYDERFHPDAADSIMLICAPVL